MNTIALVIASSIFTTLPLGNNSIEWGLSEKALKQSYSVKKVSDGSDQGHGYSDFTEVNPIVYVDNSSPDKKIEFYFHKDKLYKTYTIYLDQNNIESFYQQKIKSFNSDLGAPTKMYSDELFSMSIQHNVWEFENEQLDLRFGAGYVYEVRTYKPVANEKQIEIELKHSI